MRTRVAKGLVVLLLFCGCGGAAKPTKGETQQRFVAKELHASFSVPPRWTTSNAAYCWIFRISPMKTCRLEKMPA